MEILAPAGSFDAVMAAVRSGADAVYFGASGFNARQNAENIGNIKDTVKYCHIRGVRAYLTLNTLVSDAEMSAALILAKEAAMSGIDALIVQDAGLAMMIKKCCPDLPLHASTQMSIHNLPGARRLHECGYKRVVLSREVSADEMEHIAEYANAVGLELEVFVQGALCMSVSGQCMFSALLGGRSGNRGLCAGTCRLPFLVEGGNGYDLSLRDVNLYRHIDRLRKMNIASLKIEGRMKRPEYVAMAVDCAIAARDGGDVDNKLDRLQKIFSRSGFTDGYFTANRDKNMFGVRSEQDIENSKEIKNSAHEIYRREYPHVDVSFRFTSGAPATLTATDGEHTVTVSGDVVEPAMTRPTTADEIISRLEKTGGTPYKCVDAVADILDDSFISPSSINALKSEALERLTALRGEIKPYKWQDVKCNEYSHRPAARRKIVQFCRTDNIVANTGADIVVLPLNTPDNIVCDLQKYSRVAVSTPGYFADERAVYDELCRHAKNGVKYAVAENIGAIDVIKSADMSVIGGAGLNVFNSHSTKSDVLSGCDIFALSRELSSAQANGIRCDKPTAFYVYGRLPLMMLRNCPRRANVGCAGCDGRITDRKNIDFKLMCHDGITRLYSDRVLYMADRLDEIKTDYIWLYFTDEETDNVIRVMDDYAHRRPPTGLYTRGLTSKGVL